jgi:hypothetical protein
MHYRRKAKEIWLTAAIVALINVGADVYINPETVKLVRPATPSEMDGKHGPLTKIIMFDNLQVYVEGSVIDTVAKLKSQGKAE